MGRVRKGDPGEDRRGNNKCQEAMRAQEGTRMELMGLMVRMGTEVAKGAGKSLREALLL